MLGPPDRNLLAISGSEMTDGPSSFDFVLGFGFVGWANVVGGTVFTPANVMATHVARDNIRNLNNPFYSLIVYS
jgi:hypothetical protein